VALLLLVITIAADPGGFLRTLPHALPVGSLFVLGSLLAGSAAAYALGCDRREGVTITVEFATRNVAIATTIAVTVMGRPEFATFGVAYFLTEVPLGNSMPGFVF
jgi:predicted Na+-dependent transporter